VLLGGFDGFVLVVLTGVLGRDDGGRSLKVFGLLLVAGGLPALLGGLTGLPGLLTALFGEPGLGVTGRLGLGCTPLACVGIGWAGGAILTLG
jgi:hypothetical protein